ncbi:zinc finger and BTB domain-containing protein 49-like [Gouania willdenowi]|uniref:zinc finger and BTB domain-containing protein 49-like n=1 Tax=Gouania willdenowi TaxID=441366 RepID=UPI001054317E|nr:zinc finger and BTB domain-containing protein 49-like [Gouania willdenowi]
MLDMQSLRMFLSERLTLAAEEIFDAVERTMVEYQEELCRSKDLEIRRLRMQLRLIKSDSRLDGGRAQPQQDNPHPPHQDPLHQSPLVEAPELHHCQEEEEEGEAMKQEHREQGTTSMDQEQSEPPLMKKERERSHRDFWMVHDSEQLEDEDQEEKEFVHSPASLKNSLHDPTLAFHPYQHQHHNNNSGGGDESREKPYSCSVCEKRFSNCSHLAAHIRTHTGERPYMCDICRKSFITTSALNRHQTIHTEGKRFVCNYCGKSFKWSESLGRHIRSVHKNDTLPEPLPLGLPPGGH